MKTADIVEIFSSIQGEGPHIGERHLFLRLCGCNIKCQFCDTEFKKAELAQIFLKKEIILMQNPTDTKELAQKIHLFDSTQHSFLSITGGEPLIHTEFLKEFIPMINIPIYLETNGTMPDALEEVVSLVDVISSDIKLPSSTGLRDFYNEHKKFIEIAKKNKKEIFLKAVITSKITDDEIKMLELFSKSADLIIQPVSTKNEKLNLPKDKLFDILDKIPDARIIPQCHKFLDIM